MNTTKDTELLDADQVAQILKLHPQTVRRLVREKRITAHKLGTGAVRSRGLRIPRGAVDSYLRESSVA